MSAGMWLGLFGGGWLLIIAFVLLGAAWNKEGDERDRVMLARHYSDEDKYGET